MIPEGISCSAVLTPSITSVWPALWPPWKRTTAWAWSVSQSTTLPLPSSPHCVPTTTTLRPAPSAFAVVSMLAFMPVLMIGREPSERASAASALRDGPAAARFDQPAARRRLGSRAVAAAQIGDDDLAARAQVAHRPAQ